MQQQASTEDRPFETNALAHPNSVQRTARHAPRKRPLLTLSLASLFLFLSLALFAPLLTPYSPLDIDASAIFQPPSRVHIFGTDELGRDILTRSLYGARVSLVTGVFAAIIAAAIGTPLGLISGYFGRAVDATTMRLIDVLAAIPAILLAMIIIVLAGPSLSSTIVAVGVTSIPVFSRLARASTLAIKESDFMLASRALGGRHIYLMSKVILPNALDPIRVQLIITIAVAILLEAALSFLGLGIQPPTPSWGGMLQAAKGYLHVAPYYAVFPGLLLTGLVWTLDATGHSLKKRRTRRPGGPRNRDTQ